MDRKVKELGERVTRGRAERKQDAERDKVRRDREQEIADAPDTSVMGFWCTECARDFTTTGHKYKNWVYNLDSGQCEPPNEWRAWYVADCPSPKRHRCIRRITDKIGDPYYWQSVAVRRDQALHADDFMLPSDPRFPTVYPRQWARIQAERERREQADHV